MSHVLIRPAPEPVRSPRCPPPAAAAVDALCQALAAQASVGDSLRALRGWLGEHAGAPQWRLGWYVEGRVALATSGEPPPGAAALGDADWCAAMEEAIDQGQALCHPEAPTPGAPVAPWVTRAHAQLAGGGRCACTVILPGTAAMAEAGEGASPLGALSLVWPAGPETLTPAELAVWQAFAQRLAPVLAWQRLADRPWHGHVRQAWRRTWQRWRARTGASRWRALGLLLSTAALLLVWPWPDQAGGRARVEGGQQQALVAPSDGFIQRVLAHPGDQVRAGQVLADLAQQDLQLAHDRWASESAQQDNSYAAAMTRGDRAEAALALSRQEEAQAQLALVDAQLQRTQLKAPFDGILIQGDLSQSVGAPVKQGDTLMTVASTRRWRVIVDIDESDVARIAAGQRGQLALSALPWDTLPLQVVRITPLSRQVDGRNVFEVEARFTAAVPPEVRPGLMGQAKIEVGHTPLAWHGLRPVVARLRLAWWSWWG